MKFISVLFVILIAALVYAVPIYNRLIKNKNLSYHRTEHRNFRHDHRDPKYCGSIDFTIFKCHSVHLLRDARWTQCNLIFSNEKADVGRSLDHG